MAYSVSSPNCFFKKKKKVCFYEITQAQSKSLNLDIACKDTKLSVPGAYNRVIHSIVIGLIELVMD